MALRAETFDVLIDGETFKDEYGRQLILRGVNLTSKVPSKPDGSTHLKRRFESHREVSFVGRPFPLEEADEHFSRIKHWGFFALRLGVNWEAIEHRGPGIYDEEYLDYLEKLVQKADHFGLKIFIDFHQDVWSRFTGGDGAPGWTLELAGFNIDHLEETGAAVLHGLENDKSHILWATNAYKLAAATMSTLFFGGHEFAPNKRVFGKNIGCFLQEAYIGVIKEVVKRLRKYPAVIGYDIMNEPFAGYIGCHDLSLPFGLLKLGETPTPFQGMILGDGNSAFVDIWKQRFLSIQKVEKKEINRNKLRAWQEESSCIWQEVGIWNYNDKGEPFLTKPDYFKKYSFEEDFYKPFINKVGKEIHAISPKSILLIEHIIGSVPPKWSEGDAKNVIFTGHWYDALVLVTKRFSSYIGIDMFTLKKIIALPKWVRKAFAKQIHYLKMFAKERMGNIPFVITEFGIPLDLGGKKAYQTGDFTMQEKALHRSFLAIDDNLISSFIWNYTCNNSNVFGDNWNEEDLSIFSRDQQKSHASIYSGARAKHALIRPYPIKTAGRPHYFHFYMEKRSFEYQFEHDPNLAGQATEIFLPDLHFGSGFTIELSDGHYTVLEKSQILCYYHSNKHLKHTIKVTSRS